METLASFAPKRSTVCARKHSCLIAGSDSGVLRAVSLILRGWGFHVAQLRDFAGVLRERPHLLIADADRNPSLLEEIDRLRMQGWRGKLVLFATPPGAITPNQRRRLGRVVVLRKPFRLAELFRAVGGK